MHFRACGEARDPLFPEAALHLAPAPVFSFRDITTTDESGAGLIGNAAFTYALSNSLSVSLEGSGLLNYDAETDVVRGPAVPMLSISILFWTLLVAPRPLSARFTNLTAFLVAQRPSVRER